MSLALEIEIGGEDRDQSERRERGAATNFLSGIIGRGTAAVTRDGEICCDNSTTTTWQVVNSMLSSFLSAE